jgi:hypothetical protein
MLSRVLLWLAVSLPCGPQGVPTAPTPSPAAGQAALNVRQALDGPGRDVADGADFAVSPGYRAVVAALLEMKPQDVAAQSPLPLDAARARVEPEALRGSWVSARGTVSAHRKIPLDPPVAGVAEIDRTIFKLDAKTAIICDLIGDPPPYKSQRDTVLVSGIFYRTVGYESDLGTQVVLPYMLARSMELVDTPGSRLGKSLLHGGSSLYLAVGLGFVAVYLLVWYLRRTAGPSS